MSRACFLAMVVVLVSGCERGFVIEELAADPSRLDVEAPRLANAAAQKGREVLFYFQAGWCEPCQRLKQAFRRQENRALLSRYYLVQVDVDLMPRARALGLDVRFIPMLARLSPRGGVAGTLGGDAFGEDPSPEQVDTVLRRFLSPSAAR